MRLYILGNGFDLYHGLPSAYSDFRNFVEEHEPSLFNAIEKYYNYDGDFWSNFEISLGKVNGLHIIYDAWNRWYQERKINNSEHVTSPAQIIEAYTYGVYEMIKHVMFDWIAKLNIAPISHVYKDLDKTALFLTNTLERHYNIPADHICYIHGNIHEGEEYLVFGHDTVVPGMEEYIMGEHQGEQGYMIVREFIEYSRKQVEELYDSHKDCCWKHMLSIDDVVIIGHSLSRIDLPYITNIAKLVDKDSTGVFHVMTKTTMKITGPRCIIVEYVHLLSAPSLCIPKLIPQLTPPHIPPSRRTIF